MSFCDHKNQISWIRLAKDYTSWEILFLLVIFAQKLAIKLLFAVIGYQISLRNSILFCFEICNRQKSVLFIQKNESFWGLEFFNISFVSINEVNYLKAFIFLLHKSILVKNFYNFEVLQINIVERLMYFLCGKSVYNSDK